MIYPQNDNSPQRQAILSLAIELAERHQSLESAQWVMRFFGILTFGIESVEFPENDSRMEYVNTGDTYDLTVVYDHSSCTYYTDSWGGWLGDVEDRYSESSDKERCPNCGGWSGRGVSCDHCGYALCD